MSEPLTFKLPPVQTLQVCTLDELQAAAGDSGAFSALHPRGPGGHFLITGHKGEQGKDPHKKEEDEGKDK